MLKLRQIFTALPFFLLPLSAPAQPTLTDDDLLVESVVTVPNELLTGITFIDNNDMLVTVKSNGHVLRVTNGTNQGAVLDLPVNSASERGLLDIALDPQFEEPATRYVYLYYTAAAVDGAAAIANRVSRFKWNGSALVDEEILIDLPVTPGHNHNGGIIKFGPPNVPAAQQKLFIIIGDLNRDGQTQNNPTGPAPDFTGQILRLNPDGSTPTGVERGPFYDVAGTNSNLEVMYAYGVRNSFGMDFDPVTGTLWNTENGPTYGDEINLVEPGFNSGWKPVMGMISGSPTLVDFSGVGTYSDPEFVWSVPVAVTAIHFVRGTALGSDYENACLVGESNNGRIYHFPMNDTRTGFNLSDHLADLVLNAGESDAPIRFGNDFNAVINMTTGPDGNLYVLGYNTVYRIRSTGASVSGWEMYE